MATPSTLNNTNATVDTLATMLRTAAATCLSTADALKTGTTGTGGILNSAQQIAVNDAAERLVAVIAHSAGTSTAAVLTALTADSATRLTALTTRRTAKANELASADEAATFTGTVVSADTTL